MLMSVLLLALPAHAQDTIDAVLYDTTLSPQRITLIDLDTEAQRIVYEDTQGNSQEAAFADVLRLTFPVDAMELAEPLPVLATTDGQRIVGRAGQMLYAAHGTDDLLGWRDADGFPALGVSLDDLAWAVFQPALASPPGAQPTDDVLMMPNGERLVGFVDVLGVKGVDFVMGDADDAIEIDTSRVAGLVMSNAMRSEVESGVWLTTRAGSRWHGTLGHIDGTLAFASPLVIPPAEAEGMPVWQPVRLGSADHAEQDGWPVVSRIDLPSPGRRLVALASLPMSLIEGGEVFGVEMPPGVSAQGSITLHAPVSVEFDLPRGATRLAATVALAIGEDVPIERHAWAGCEVVVRVGDAELTRVALDADHPEQPINCALPTNTRAQTLRLTVEESVNGPVLDRVELRNAELLVTR